MTKSTTAQSVSALDDQATPAACLSFLDLPAEIRNTIYRFSLIESSPDQRIRGLVQPPLARTNRQVRSESLPIYYGNNRFQVEIPPKGLMLEPDHWADFIRMFRVFKAGRVEGRPGTGSLQFLRDISFTQDCGTTRQSFDTLQVIFSVPDGRHTLKQASCTVWDKCSAFRTTKGHLMKKRDHVYKRVAKALQDRAAMSETCVGRLISTVLMVANECPGVIREVHFHADWSMDEEEFGLDYW
ncbi:hypothetical protein KVR01_012004 [Diaporthe batatas]|uniref:uncharacterized protein n=1 Tax=Diaporthe batatas TaxID=748121 RepID=UPI001D045897|nr:uncharacterized protein KVR01_012004 [Diaporthe batatas]KAG8158243.1 hypothetical protein KVR01_012004 [Diaporthe batatas]